MLLPLDKRTSFERRVVLAYLGGSITGATSTALIAWLLSGLTQPLGQMLRIGLVLSTAILVWAIKKGPLRRRLRLPEARRQIPAAVFTRSLVRGAWQFGLEMGTGMRTYLPSVAPYVLFFGLILARPTLLQTVVVAIGFGFGRAVPLMVRLGRDQREYVANEFFGGAQHRLAQSASTVLVTIGVVSLV